ncbi:MAG: YicC/YloC family endoribonuclease [Succinatimonas sp.]|nr:YicC/YloC family endoribonuclease [Succinatimonas sp.]
MTVSSMTGSASVQVNTPEFSFNLIINTVNNRYLDIYLKLPENLRHLDGEIRKLITSNFTRGKFDLLLNLKNESSYALVIDETKLQQLQQLVKTVANYLPGTVNPVEILNYPGILKADDSLQPQLEELFFNALKQALSELKQNRINEGENLITALKALLGKIENNLDKLSPILNTLVIKERAKIKERLAKIDIKLDENRLEQEVALATQKADIREEYDRLRSHVKESYKLLDKGGVIGKRFDFMLQEFNREANTLASKASSLEITEIAVDLKVIIEQIREQVQNLE